MKKISFILVLLCLAACQSVNFMQKNTLVSPPEGKQAKVFHLEWRSHVNSEADKAKTNLSFAIEEGQLFTLSADGDLNVFDVASGKKKRTHHFHRAMQAGPSVFTHFLVIATQDGRVEAYDQETWRKLWQVKINSEIFTPVVINDEKIFIQTLDGKLYALDTATGQQEWFYQQVMPSLVLRAYAPPQVIDEKVMVSFANAHVLALNRELGNVIWERIVAEPQGKSPISRMVDIVAPTVHDETTLYIAGYQGQLTALDLQTGEKRWSHPFSSLSGLTLNNQMLYATDEQGLLSAFDASTGLLRWQQNLLKKRHLSAPVLINDYLIVGDHEGNIYAFSAIDGKLVQSLHLANDDFSYIVKSYENKVFFLGRKGTLIAIAP